MSNLYWIIDENDEHQKDQHGEAIAFRHLDNAQEYAASLARRIGNPFTVTTDPPPGPSREAI